MAFIVLECGYEEEYDNQRQFSQFHFHNSLETLKLFNFVITEVILYYCLILRNK